MDLSKEGEGEDEGEGMSEAGVAAVLVAPRRPGLLRIVAAMIVTITMTVAQVHRRAQARIRSDFVRHAHHVQEMMHNVSLS